MRSLAKVQKLFQHLAGMCCRCESWLSLSAPTITAIPHFLRCFGSQNFRPLHVAFLLPYDYFFLDYSAPADLNQLRLSPLISAEKVDFLRLYPWHK